MSDRFIRARASRSNRRPLSKRLRFQVLERDSFTCQYCGCGADKDPLHVDHIWAHSRGGPDLEWNLIASCEPCNSGKSAIEVDSARLRRSANMVLAKHGICREMYARFGRVPEHEYFEITITPFFILEEMEACLTEYIGSDYEGCLMYVQDMHHESMDTWSTLQETPPSRALRVIQ